MMLPSLDLLESSVGEHQDMLLVRGEVLVTSAPGPQLMFRDDKLAVALALPAVAGR